MLSEHVLSFEELSSQVESSQRQTIPAEGERGEGGGGEGRGGRGGERGEGRAGHMRWKLQRRGTGALSPGDDVLKVFVTQVNSCLASDGSSRHCSSCGERGCCD